MAFPKDKQAWIDNFQQITRDTAVETLEISLVDIDDDTVVLLHGGVSMVLAETAASFHASWGVDFNLVAPVGIEINGSHLRSATDGHVRAVGRVLRRSRALIVHEVEIVHEESGQLLSIARVTNYYKPQKPLG
jgi:1,4-dihydroxy-2-naphthoyl-CoA hydrolase